MGAEVSGTHTQRGGANNMEKARDTKTIILKWTEWVEWLWYGMESVYDSSTVDRFSRIAQGVFHSSYRIRISRTFLSRATPRPHSRSRVDVRSRGGLPGAFPRPGFPRCHRFRRGRAHGRVHRRAPGRSPYSGLSGLLLARRVHRSCTCRFCRQTGFTRRTASGREWGNNIFFLFLLRSTHVVVIILVLHIFIHQRARNASSWIFPLH